MTDYGESLVAHFLMNELRAEGHLERYGNDLVYVGDRCDYVVTVTAKKINKTVRLSED